MRNGSVRFYHASSLIHSAQFSQFSIFRSVARLASMTHLLERLEPRKLLSSPYQVQDLGTLGGDIVTANDINNRGQVVGAAKANDGNLHAFLWSLCGMVDLRVSSLNDAYATAINNRGQIIGTANYDAGLVGAQAFVYSNGKVQFLPRSRDPDNNFAVDINDAGEIITFETHITGNELGS